ncbi:MAG: hypothetical protein K0S47_1739 [Herbinix sp.]|jgi:hypothetical protein|nr:hypothetical protein [Herbinix sp.]
MINTDCTILFETFLDLLRKKFYNYNWQKIGFHINIRKKWRAENE